MLPLIRPLRSIYKRWVPEKVRAFVWFCILEPRRFRSRVGQAKAWWTRKGYNSLYDWHIAQAVKATQALDADLALLHLGLCAKTNPADWEIWQRRAIIHLQLTGDLNEAMKQFAVARELREQLRPNDGPQLNYRFLHAFWGYQIGHIANIEHLIKREILLGRDPKNLIMHFPASAKPGNRALLRKMAKIITLVPFKFLLPAPISTMTSVLEEYYTCDALDGRLKHWWHASPEIFEAWEQAGQQPLLSFSRSEVRKGRKALARLGLPEDAWFVTLHVRDSSFKKKQGYGAIEAILNADVAVYAQAIDAIVARGGWVIRIGHESSQSLPPMPNVIDYAQSRDKTPETDLYILGAGRFFIGTSSGPSYVPPLFGIPCVLTNWAPTGQRPFNSRDLYIPKMYDEPISGTSEFRPMKFGEFLGPPIGYAASCMRARSLRVVANSSTEILEVVAEMLDRLDGRTQRTAEDEQLQAKFNEIAAKSRCIGNARLGAEFLRHHRDRL